MQIFREVYANVYFRAVFLANVYFAYTCGKPYSAILSPPARDQRTERKSSRMRNLILIALAATGTLTLCAAKEYEWPQLPEGVLPDSEVSTNVTIHVNMSRLDEFALRIEAANCVSNEVMVAIGHDADEDGDLLPRTPSSSLLSLPCADAQGWDSTLLDNARKSHLNSSSHLGT